MGANKSISTRQQYFKPLNWHYDADSYKNTGGLCRFGYGRVYQFPASVLGDMRGETQFLKAYLTILCWPYTQRTAHLVVFKISIHLCPWRPPKYNLIRSEKLNRYLQRSTSANCLQNHQILWTISSGRDLINPLNLL